MHFPPVSHLFQWEELFFEGTPFAINKTVLMLFLSTVIVLALFIVGSRRQALVPRGIQNVAEAAYDLIEKNVSLEVMNSDDGKRWTPLFVCLFFWIFFLNVFGIVPFLQFPAGSRFAIPLYLALQTYVIMLFMGFKAQGPKYITNSIFPSGVPWPLYILVTPIELISIFVVRPFSLAVRLFANLMAGHILLAVFALMCAALWATEWYAVLLPLPFIMSVAMTLFELLVAVLQAYIFTILTAVYVNESMHPAH